MNISIMQLAAHVTALETFVYSIAATHPNRDEMIAAFKTCADTIKSHFDYSNVPNDFHDEVERKLNQYLEKMTKKAEGN